MFSDKLIGLLQTFSRYELNRFRKFLLSPYFNEQEDVIRLFDLINNALRKSETEIEYLDKQTVWKAVYPGKKIDDANLRRLASDLTQLGLRFLVEEARNNNPLSEALDLQAVLEKPELKKHLAGAERHLEKLIEQYDGVSTDYYLARFKINWQIYNRATKVVAASVYFDKLQAADTELDCFYFIQKLKFYIGWLIYRGFREAPQDLPIVSGIWEYIADKRFANEPLIGVYKQIVLCLTEPGAEAHFDTLIALLKEKSNKIAKNDLRECYQIAQNYCAFKINQGRTEYYNIYFNLFKDIIRLDILLESEQLSEGVFKNVVTSSLRVGEFDWAENFINEHAQYLPLPIRENARTFNLANLYSHQKKYDKVIELLRNVEYSDVAYALSAKLILVRTYYETDEIMALDSLLDSSRIFLRRNKLITKSAKTEYSNFLSFVKKLSALNPGDKQEIERVRQRIEKCNSVNSKKWLLEKIGDLQKRPTRGHYPRT